MDCIPGNGAGVITLFDLLDLGIGLIEMIQKLMWAEIERRSELDI